MVPSVGTTLIREPGACTEEERAAFAEMVRRGFGRVPDDRRDRIRRAARLAFQFRPGDALVGIAALKAPGEGYRADVFAQAGVDARPTAFALELGWVFVDPPCRGQGIARTLCGELLASTSRAGLFATTRPDNHGMIRVLEALGFERAGTPYARGGESLALFLRAGPGP